MADEKKYIIYSMRAKCDQGSMENYLTTVTGHGVVYQGNPLLNANDHVEQDNLTHFGDCKSMKKFDDARKQAAEKYKAEEGDGFFDALGKGIMHGLTDLAVGAKQALSLISNKCELDTPLPWQFTNDEYIIDGAPALTMDSVCACRCGGTISVVHVEEEVPDIDTAFLEILNELNNTVLTDPTNISKITELLLQLSDTKTINNLELKGFRLIEPIVSQLFAFEYVGDRNGDGILDGTNENFYITNDGLTLQYFGGFLDLYDHLGPLLGMDLATETVVFTPDGSEKEYRLQFWAGSYGWRTHNGSEIGFYSRDVIWKKILPYGEGNLQQLLAAYTVVTDESGDQLRTIQRVFNAHTEEVISINDTAEYGTAATNGDQYWNLCIRDGINITSKDLVIEEVLYVPDENMRNAMIKELRKNKNLTLNEKATKGEVVVVQFGEFIK